mmetsp:Transcript_13064/g.36062  ORF Transcript_13064/g.36062 Transcript_13064/m.36062 type:complete len:217 (-) Transcript_13064:171-821(-)
MRRSATMAVTSTIRVLTVQVDHAGTDCLWGQAVNSTSLIPQAQRIAVAHDGDLPPTIGKAATTRMMTMGTNMIPTTTTVTSMTTAPRKATSVEVAARRRRRPLRRAGTMSTATANRSTWMRCTVSMVDPCPEHHQHRRRHPTRNHHHDRCPPIGITTEIPAYQHADDSAARNVPTSSKRCRTGGPARSRPISRTCPRSPSASNPRRRSRSARPSVP